MIILDHENYVYACSSLMQSIVERIDKMIELLKCVEKEPIEKYNICMEEFIKLKGTINGVVDYLNYKKDCKYQEMER